MAAFDNGSKPSIKGTEITFKDVPDIVERKNSKVIFKSSGNGRVICELGPSIEKRNVQISVGGPLTVIGRVRGRGLLGNVTLDECHLAPIDGNTASSDVVSQAPEPAAPPGPLPSEPATAAAPGEPYPEPTTAAPPAPPQEPARKLPKTNNAKATRPVNTRVREMHAAELEQPNDVTKEVSSPPKLLPYTPYAIVVIFISLGLLALVKLLSPALGAMRSRRPSNYVNTPETRQAALEALLLGDKKKR